MRLKQTYAGTGILLLALIFGLESCQKNDSPIHPNKDLADDEVVLYWNDKASQVIATPMAPPTQARYFAIVQIAVHDALNGIAPVYEQYALHNVREKKANPQAAVSSAAYWTLKSFNLGTFPLDDWYNERLSLIPAGEDKELGIQLGKQASDAIIANRLNDGLAASIAAVPVPDGILPGEYRSTLFFSDPGQPKVKGIPNWGTSMKTFVTKNSTQFRSPGPDAIETAAYVKDFNEVKAKGAKENHSRTAEESEIGVFWVERSSMGWNRFARNTVKNKHQTAWETARMLALMNVSMVDAATACFESKYHFFYWRPETAIRLADNGNASTIGDPNWLPLYADQPNAANPALTIHTPPIPDYPSLHADFGGAAAEALKLFFETDKTSVYQTSSTTPGVTRFYNSFSKAARDNSLSRIYVGYHFRKACLDGEAQGKAVAQYIVKNSFRKGDLKNIDF